MSDQAVEIHDLVKRFGAFVAVDHVSLQVKKGEIFGFLGPNGAGKSTTIRILLGLVKADGGNVRLLGGDPWSDAVALHRQIAYVPGDVTLWPSLTGGDQVPPMTSGSTALGKGASSVRSRSLAGR